MENKLSVRQKDEVKKAREKKKKKDKFGSAIRKFFGMSEDERYKRAKKN